MAPAFDLTQNPFHLLGLSIRARREEVVEAHEDALADGRTDEDVLARAQQAVLTPRTRIGAEVSWFLNANPSQAREILSKLEQNNLADAIGNLEHLQGLDRANLAAHLCARLGGDAKNIDFLLEAYKDFTFDDVQVILEGLRSVSGFPIPDQKQVSGALADLRIFHAKAAVSCLIATKNPGEVLTETVEMFLAWGDDNVEHLLDLIVREYDAWSQPFLATIREKIETEIGTCRGNSNPVVPVERLANMLAEWDSINQPVQLLEEAKGHEEPRSKGIYEIVRNFCLWLANENGKYKEALAISRALLETFPELPAVAAQLSKDVDALESLAEEAKSIELMGPLVRAVEATKTKTTTFCEDVAASGFGPNSRGLGKNLYDAFVDVASKTAGTELADMPWMVVREIAIELNNKQNSPEGACAILEGLISHKDTTPTKAVVGILKDDRRTLRRNLKWEELKHVSGNVQKGIVLVADLLDGADQDERAALLQIKKTLERKRAATVRKLVFWGLAAAALVGFLVYNANKKPSYSPRPSPTTTLTPTTPQPSNSAPSSLYEELKPTPGTGRVLNRNQVRYCIFQGKRLDILRGLVSSNSEIDQFNRMVGDFNSRCSSFQYRQGVLRAIEAEVPGRRQHLWLDAQRIFSSWRASSFSRTMDDQLIDISTVSGVNLVQSRLKELGHYAGRVDGIWGPASRAALRNFKLSQSGLRNDDAWDLVTQRALMGR